MIGIEIEFGPYGDHDTGIHLMDPVDHSLRVGESGRVELVAAPLLFGPIAPVLYDVIDGYFSFSEFSECAHNLILRFIPFTALPESHSPFGHDLRFPGKGSVATDHFVHTAARHEIVIDAIAHLTPER